MATPTALLSHAPAPVVLQALQVTPTQGLIHSPAAITTQIVTPAPSVDLGEAEEPPINITGTLNIDATISGTLNRGSLSAIIDGIGVVLGGLGRDLVSTELDIDYTVTSAIDY
jgi:hypothetical protein